MRAATVVVAIALIAAVVCDQAALYSSFTKPAVNKYCRRNMVAANILGTATVVATLGCVSATNSSAVSGRYGVIGFQMSTILLPNFGIYSFGIGGSGKAGDAYLFGARFTVDSMVEYLDTNGVAGYQPGQDTLIKYYSFIRIPGWPAPVYTTQKVDDTTTVHKLTTTLSPDLSNPHTVTWGAMATTDEVIASDNTNQKVVLTPNSFKTIFALSGFKYTSTDERTRIALGTVLITAGATSQWSTTARSVDGDRPNEVTPSQGVFGIGASASGTANGFFSYQKFVSTSDGVTQSGATRAVTLTAQDFYVDNNQTSITKDAKEASISLKRVWFSLNERITSFSWDPTVGNQETQENQVPTTGSASTLSCFAIIITFVITLFL